MREGGQVKLYLITDGTADGPVLKAKWEKRAVFLFTADTVK